MNHHIAMIKEQNDHIAKSNAKTVEHENEKFKLLIVFFIMGDTLALRMTLAFNKGAKATSNLMPLRIVSGTIIRGTLKTPKYQLVTPISTKLQRPHGCD
jgi:hypothetical protein